MFTEFFDPEHPPRSAQFITASKHLVPGLASQLLDNEDLEARFVAVNLLGELGPAARPAVAELQRLLDSREDEDEEYLRQRAGEVMARIWAL